MTFLIGVILGVTAAAHGPALVAPYLPRGVARPQTRIDGQVVRKQRDGNRLLVKVDTGQGPMLVTFTQKVADRALQRLEVDAAGLDAMDRRILGSLIDKFGGGPVGLETIATAVGERSDTLEDCRHHRPWRPRGDADVVVLEAGLSGNQFSRMMLSLTASPRDWNTVGVTP